METVTPDEREGARKPVGLHAKQVGAFDFPERQAAFAARILKCVGRTFQSIGASPATEEVVFWNLYVTRNLGRDGIVEKPLEFMEGLKAIYGEAGMVVFEYKLTKEIKEEFGLGAEFDKEPIKPRDLADLLRLVAYAALES